MELTKSLSLWERRRRSRRRGRTIPLSPAIAGARPKGEPLDAVVEIEFENLLEWQIKDNQSDIFDVSVFFNKNNLIVWMDDIYTSAEDMKKGSYVIAESMKWRITK